MLIISRLTARIEEALCHIGAEICERIYRGDHEGYGLEQRHVVVLNREDKQPANAGKAE